MKGFLLFMTVAIFVVFGVISLLMLNLDFGFLTAGRPTGSITIRYEAGHLNCTCSTNACLEREQNVNVFRDNQETRNRRDRFLGAGTFENPGHTFVHWLNQTTGQTHSAGSWIPGGLSQDFTLVAVWSVATFTVSFNTQTPLVANPASINATFNQPINNLPTVSRTGYTFNGWVAPDGTPIFNGMLSQITQNTTLVASWTRQGGVPFTTNFTIFMVLCSPDAFLNPAIPGNQITVNSGNVWDNLPTPLRSRHNFLGWTVQNGGLVLTTNFAVALQLVEGQTAITIFGNWMYDPNAPVFFEFTMNFNPNRAGVANPHPAGLVINQNSNMGAALPTLTHATGIFLGWQVGGINVATPHDVFNQLLPGQTQVTLVGRWVNHFTINFSVPAGATFVGGVNPFSVNMASHLALDFAGMGIHATQPGFAFAGWFAPGFPNRMYTIADVANILGSAQTAITLNAQFAAESITISLNPMNGQAVTNIPHINGNPLPGSVSVPVRPGFDFQGFWDTDAATGGNMFFAPNGMRTTVAPQTFLSSFTLYARWTPTPVVGSLNITFDANFGLVFGSPTWTTFVAAGQSFIFPTPVRSQYVFEGWWLTVHNRVDTIEQLRALTVGLTVVTLTAYWTPVPGGGVGGPQTFRIHFIWNDGSPYAFESRIFQANERPTLHDTFAINQRNSIGQFRNDSSRFFWPGLDRIAWTPVRYGVIAIRDVFVPNLIELTDHTLAQINALYGSTQITGTNTWVIRVYELWTTAP